jgi:dTMP kinase
LYAVDRCHQVETEVRPHTEAGRTVITDRYVTSDLVMQRFDGIEPASLWNLNAEADRPDLAVILEAELKVISKRLTARATQPLPALARQ